MHSRRPVCRPVQDPWRVTRLPGPHLAAKADAVGQLAEPLAAPLQVGVDATSRVGEHRGEQAKHPIAVVACGTAMTWCPVKALAKGHLPLGAGSAQSGLHRRAWGKVCCPHQVAPSSTTRDAWLPGPEDVHGLVTTRGPLSLTVEGAGLAPGAARHASKQVAALVLDQQQRGGRLRPHPAHEGVEGHAVLVGVEQQPPLLALVRRQAWGRRPGCIQVLVTAWFKRCGRRVQCMSQQPTATRL